MRVTDDDGQVLGAEYSVEGDGGHLALILESAGGATHGRPARNPDYRHALLVLLTRLGGLGAVLRDALVDSAFTQRHGIKEPERRLIRSPVRLADEADMEALRLRLTAAQAGIGQAPHTTTGGNSSKRIRLRLDVPGFGPDEADGLAVVLGEPDAYLGLFRSPEELPEGQTLPGGTLRRHEGTRHERLDWTREEVILAIDIYVTVGAFVGGPIPGNHSAEIVQLSELLQKLSAYPPELQGEKYRNPDGVYLKLMNLRAIQSEGAHGMNAYSRLDAAIWREYVDDLPRLHAEAAAIRVRLQEGIIKPAKAGPVMEDVDIEQQHTETFLVTPSGEPRPAERAEQQLVLRYRDYMTAKRIAVRRKKYLPAGEVRPIYSDAWVEVRRVLIEAKNSDSRDAIRQAIGQLYDYRRFHQPPVRLAVLLPYPPKAERLDLLRSAGVEALWPHGSGFRDSAQGAFV